jgi:hypothetical protein
VFSSSEMIIRLLGWPSRYKYYANAPRTLPVLLTCDRQDFTPALQRQDNRSATSSLYTTRAVAVVWPAQCCLAENQYFRLHLLIKVFQNQAVGRKMRVMF